MKPLIINALFALCIFQVSGQNSPPPAPGPPGRPPQARARPGASPPDAGPRRGVPQWTGAEGRA